jgi:queuine tRNA-ribosyltransferase
VSAFRFELLARNGQARRGRVHSAHGVIDTPAFMPVGTQATVKAMTVEAVRATGAQIVLGNTYHLMLRPGAARIERLGGLHKFMNWPSPILTDSGGFQVMSLAKLRQIDETGVTFQSHIDGSRHELTPERAVQLQHQLGSDITMVLDECTPHPASHDVAARSMALSMRWAVRSKQAFVARPGHALFGIVQGGVYADLRAESAASLIDTGFEGYAIGGLAVGEGQDAMFEVLEATVPHLPVDRSRYLMGVGLADDIVGAVQRGVDMFDCVLPTRSGRTGRAYVRGGSLNIRNARHADDPRPLQEDCGCPACTGYSRAYLHHLHRSGEMLGGMLLTWHNLHYYQQLMAGLRLAITQNDLDGFAARFREEQAAGDIEPIGSSHG